MTSPEAETAERPARQRKPATPSHLIKANLEHRALAALAPSELPGHKHSGKHVHGARAPPPLAERLLQKREVLAITGLSYPTIWGWMRLGKFPRSRIVGGKSMWLASEVQAWVAGLPVRPLKGDPTSHI
jgi:predicted DNA-binding transcriptional regulator AlpA